MDLPCSHQKVRTCSSHNPGTLQPHLCMSFWETTLLSEAELLLLEQTSCLVLADIPVCQRLDSV